ncbi:MAG: M3 family metallopeptidase [Burkholderiales bacterium]
MNPLLDFSGLPRFGEFKPDFVTPAVDTLLQESSAVVEGLTHDPTAPTWDNFVAPLDNANERLSRAWGQVSHLNAVMNSPQLREVYNVNLPKITQFYAELGQNQALFAKYKALRQSPEFASLCAARKKIVENELRDFRLGGAELPDDKKARFLAIQEEQSALSSKFSENILDATNAFSLYVESETELSGIPADVLQTAAEAAQKDGKSGWKFTLHAPSYVPVLQYADNRALREKMYRAYLTRAAEFEHPELNNAPLIEQILKLRDEEAKLLGYQSFAEVSLVPKMASSPQQVLDFLNDLAQRAKPYAEKDVAALREFAERKLGLTTMEPWDRPYVAEKLRGERYSFSEQEVKQYFPEPQVLAGMFRVVETLYGLTLEKSSAPVWHPAVKFFDIRDRSKKLVGQFYLDLYSRDTKRGGAWMDDAITRRRVGGGIQTPVAYLNCNFSAPVGDKPALFTHDEVITLFHEFGHGLHHLLTQVEDLSVAGINGVEWDAVELPSQFMENFCWEWDVMQHMTRHVDTGAPLPRALFDKMIAAKNFLAGMDMVRQLEFSLFDMHLHSDFDVAGPKTAQQLIGEIRKQIAVVFPPAYDRFPNSFSHIFAGGYGAGYYSYKWAEVLSADAYSLFEESGVLNEITGQRFRREILSVGGARPALDSFVAFRGREPKIDALLKHSGMQESA